jgi:hypothetical protein
MNQPYGAREGGILGSLACGRSKRLLPFLAAGALALTSLGAAPLPALAFGSTVVCGGRVEAAVFAPWGDGATYFLVPNGDFEAGARDWALSGGASVVWGNEPFKVDGAADSHSLRLPPGSSAESRTICVSQGEDAIRLFVNNRHVRGAILHVEAIARNPTTGSYGYAAFDVNGDVPSKSWAPTMRLSIPRMFDGSGVEELTLRFTLRGTPATWGIDDVYVDPYKSWW